MKLALFGTGDVGLRNNIFPIYEPSLPEIMIKNIEAGSLALITTYEEVLKEVEVIYITVGTPENEGGSANLTFLEEVVTTIALTAKKDSIVVTKSFVPSGTNDRLQQIIGHKKLYHINIGKVLNPYFLKVSIRKICLQKISEGIIQVVNKSNLKKVNDIVPVIRKLNAQLRVSLESWCV